MSTSRSDAPREAQFLMMHIDVARDRDAGSGELLEEPVDVIHERLAALDVSGGIRVSALRGPDPVEQLLSPYAVGFTPGAGVCRDQFVQLHAGSFDLDGNSPPTEARRSRC
jgi:hypothetical protein